MPSMGGEKGLARNEDSLGKYTPIPLAAQGLPNSSLCYQESSWLVHKGGNPAATWELSIARWGEQSGLCAQQARPSVGSLLNFQLAWPEPT